MKQLVTETGKTRAKSMPGERQTIQNAMNEFLADFIRYPWYCTGDVIKGMTSCHPQSQTASTLVSVSRELYTRDYDSTTRNRVASIDEESLYSRVPFFFKGVQLYRLLRET